MRTALWIGVILLALLPAGCANSPYFGKPNIRHPGDVCTQQARARSFDPFPERDSGPAVVGARPREYDMPRQEIDRSRRIWEATPYGYSRQ